MRNILFFLTFSAIPLLFSIVKSSASQEAHFSSLNTDRGEINTDDADTNVDNDLISQFSKGLPRLPEANIKEPVYSINSSYLTDRLEFKSLDNPFKEMNTKVVGNKNVKMYEKIVDNKIDDEPYAIADLPLGTVLPIIEEIHSTNKSDYGDYSFIFKNLRNYWYKVSFSGKRGYVFGSYLASAGSSENNIKLSYYYKKNTRSDSFYDFNGFKNIPPGIQERLIKDKFALERVNKNEYHLDLENPDDLISLYKKSLSGYFPETSSLFITSDLMVHCLHLLFDRMFQDVESEKLYPILVKLTGEYYRDLIKMEKNLPPNTGRLKDTVVLMKDYFSVASGILNMNLTNEFPPEVIKELDYINKADAFVDSSPLFQYKEDYTQFKPRGHYTKSDRLKRYFRAMMWFGRQHFYCSDDPLHQKLSVKLTRAALLLTKIARDNNEILSCWKALYTPINYIVGESDDYNLLNYIEISGIVDFDNFDKWIENDKNILDFIRTANTRLKGPMISGFPLDQKGNESLTDTTVPPGFRFFGQRYTFDSYIQNLLTSPRVGSREYVRSMCKGLDIMAVLGNGTADKLLGQDKLFYTNFAGNLKKLQSKVMNFNSFEWRKTFYESYLRLVKEITCFENKGFYFTQSPEWSKKSLLTSHAAWAELRHDTILYVKENESPGGCRWENPDYSILPVEAQINYLEPDLGFYYWLQSIMNDSIIMLSQAGFLNETYRLKFRDFKEIVDRFTEIAELEASDMPISTEQNEYIKNSIYSLGSIILPRRATDSDLNEKDFMMALVADVNTDDYNKTALEVATGIPYRIYVALNDRQGGKRIAIGYTYSYYEFTQPVTERLNDDEWKDQIIKDAPLLDKRIPAWIKDIIVP